MDHRAVWDFEDFLHGYGKEGKGAQLGVLLEVIIGITAYEHGSSIQSSQAFEGGCTVTFGVAPFFVPVEMIVGDHSLPEGCDFIVRQSDIATGDGTA